MSGRDVSAPARVILLRHAVTVDTAVCQGARHDEPLSDTGRQQARAAAARIGHVDACVSSPLGRACRTAAAFGAGPRLDPSWRERDFGIWEGRPWREVVDDLPAAAREDVTSYLAFTPDGGEAWTAVTARVGAALERLAHQGGTRLVVTHGGPIRAAIGHVLGVGLEHTLALRPAYATSVWLTRVPATRDDAGGPAAWQLDRFGW